MENAIEEAIAALTKVAVSVDMPAQQFGDAIWEGLSWNLLPADRDRWATALAQHMSEHGS